MGGCRCSYRSCKVRSDGQTHMFHFPVFDKMRCHQWITNSLKPNFLNLKLSQLKNRVVCQHHFKDDHFMNYMKDKLKTDAVPTEDGPYCDSDRIQILKLEENDKPTIPICADDIENETLNSLEKKAHSSVKYGDFLISDVTELFNSSHNSIDNQTTKKGFPKKLNYIKNTTNLLNEENALSSKYKLHNREENHQYTINYSNDEQTKPKFLNSNKIPTIVSIQYEEPQSNQTTNPNTLNKVTQEREVDNLNIPVFKSKPDQKNNPDKVVKILSEKTISESLVGKLGGKLEPVRPSMIIRMPIRKVQNNVNDLKPKLKEEICTNISFNADNCNMVQPDQIIAIEETLPIEYTPIDSKVNENIQENNMNVDEKSQMIINLNENDNLNNFNYIQNQNNLIPVLNNEQVFISSMLQTEEKNTVPEHIVKSVQKSTMPFRTLRSSPASKSLLKNKITPEKLAAIKEKRTFNLKLRDVITSCLDNLDDQNHNEDIDKKISQEKRKAVKRILRPQVPGPQSSPSNMITYLESRLQRMEDTLLNKIDHNTQRINELKRTIKPSSNAKHANTQTYLNHMTEQSQKQYLYKEISKFLSPDATIKIYEELFLGKTSQSDFERSSPRKLRKRR